MEYYAKFNFSKDAPEDVKNLMIKDFVTIRELAVDLTNPMLAKWNKEFDSQVGRMGDDNCIYNKWISEKFNSICDIINENCTASCVKIYSDPDLEATFRGIAKFDEDLSLYITLVEQ